MPLLHRIEDDLRGHSWYEELFVRTIAEAEEYAAREAEFAALAASVERAFTEPVQDS
jgi:hypothetical protein